MMKKNENELIINKCCFNCKRAESCKAVCAIHRDHFQECYIKCNNNCLFFKAIKMQ